MCQKGLANYSSMADADNLIHTFVKSKKKKSQQPPGLSPLHPPTCLLTSNIKDYWSKTVFKMKSSKNVFRLNFQVVASMTSGLVSVTTVCSVELISVSLYESLFLSPRWSGQQEHFKLSQNHRIFVTSLFGVPQAHYCQSCVDLSPPPQTSLCWTILVLQKTQPPLLSLSSPLCACCPSLSISFT